MTEKDLQTIQNKIGYNFTNPNLLHQAFIRKSYAFEHCTEDNEVLEFIGDKALDAVIVKILIDKYGSLSDENNTLDFCGFSCKYSEGDLTDIKSRLVQKNMLARRIDLLDFTRYLIMSEGDKKNKVHTRASVKEDLFEAIVGAAAVDCRWDIDILQKIIINMLEPDTYITLREKENYFEHIFKWHRKKHGKYPRVTISCTADGKSEHFDENEYDEKNISQDTAYCCNLKLTGIDHVFTAYGRSKSTARKNVCEAAYKYLESNDMLISIEDEIDNPNKEDSINQLETLSRRGYFGLPSYTYTQSKDSVNHIVWQCTCTIPRYPIFTCSAYSKKEAKKSAAYEMLKHVLNCDG